MTSYAPYWECCAAPTESRCTLPQPTLADLPELLEQMRANGMSVAVQTEGMPAPVIDVVELCCFRVIQEALTNAARHAPGAPVQLTVGYRPGTVTARIVNTVGDDAASRSPGVSGFGLIGMRERVVALGGTIEAGREAKVFRVEVAIPTAPVEQQP